MFSDMTTPLRSKDLETVSLRNKPKPSYFKSRHTSLRSYQQPIQHSAETPITPKKIIPQHTFGIDLSILLEREATTINPPLPIKIPSLIYYLVEYLRKKGLQESGLFRLSANHIELLGKRTAIDEGLLINEEYCEGLNIHIAADLLKSFLRSLPQPIIPVNNFFAHFLVSSNILDENIAISYLGSLVKLLPEMNYTLLKYLCNFFHEFTQFYKVNKMGAQNLAIIFAPSFFGQSDVTDSSALVLETTVTSKITKTFIEKYEEIFNTETHIPISRNVAYESYCDPVENWSIIKGEDVLVLYMPGEEDYCYIQVNGKLFKVTRLFVDSKCKSQPNFNENQSELMMNNLEIRIKALEKISTSTVIKSGFVKADYIVACAPTTLKKYETNAKKKRSRLSKKSDSSSTAGLQFNKDYMNSFPVNNQRFSDNLTSSSDNDLRQVQVNIKPKKVKKESKFNTTITAWYGAASGLSSNSFFANGLPLPRRKKEKDLANISPTRTRNKSNKDKDVANKQNKENKS